MLCFINSSVKYSSLIPERSILSRMSDKLLGYKIGPIRLKKNDMEEILKFLLDKDLNEQTAGIDLCSSEFWAIVIEHVLLINNRINLRDKIHSQYQYKFSGYRKNLQQLYAEIVQIDKKYQDFYNNEHSIINKEEKIKTIQDLKLQKRKEINIECAKSIVDYMGKSIMDVEQALNLYESDNNIPHLNFSKRIFKNLKDS